jgi:hypothetical protein
MTGPPPGDPTFSKEKYAFYEYFLSIRFHTADDFIEEDLSSLQGRLL